MKRNADDVTECDWEIVVTRSYLWGNQWKSG